MKPSKNEGIIMSGGKIEAGKLAVGKGAKIDGERKLEQEGTGSEATDQELALASRKTLSHLRQLLIHRFNDSELRDLCFDLGVDFDGLSGDNKRDKARELLLYLSRSGQLDHLTEIGSQMRPELPWQGPATS